MNRFIFIFCFNLGLIAGFPPAFATEAGEIQVLIDVSGSMKQNDPNNLRISATELLINLLPNGAKAGLWLFSEKTQSLSKTEAIDAQWREQALQASQSIHARGVYTDIESAIDTVMKNAFAAAGNNNLIILTDGMVDISKDIMVSADSRERIISEWIPRLRQRQIKVQTIALSDQADKELLEKLAFDTAGWNETAQSAEQLQRLFLKMAQKVAPKDTVPIMDNRFNIDSHIQEFSVLVFKKPSAPPTQLIAPDQQKISKQQASPEVSWLESASYDLITIKHPASGTWQIVADIDPDNQVMILTDLKLNLNELPNFIGENEALDVRLFFTEKGEVISQKDFLDLVTVSVSIDQREADNIPASADKVGDFVKTLKGLGKGRHSLNFIADGKTFKREINKDLEVVTSPIQLEKQIDAAKRQVTLRFNPDIAILDSNSLSIIALLQHGDAPQESRTITEQDGKWTLTLESLPQDPPMHIHFNVMAKTLDGRAITPVLAPITLDESLFIATDTQQPTAEAATETSNHETAAGALPDTETKTQNPPTETENSWGLVIGIVLIANILLAGIGFIVFRKLKSAKVKKQQQIMEKLA